MDLNTISFVLLGGLVAGYAVLDGFDLGVGALWAAATIRALYCTSSLIL